MRRMITEKDVEKLDSIKPSEIEKLGAMQDPQTATAGQVLTAVAGGKAEFKASAGVHHDYHSGGDTVQLRTDEKDLWGDHVRLYYSHRNIIEARLRPGYAFRVDDKNIPFTAATVHVGKESGSGTYIYVCFSEGIITKYNITAQSNILVCTEIFYY